MNTGGYITTHVLDTGLGKPAEGLNIDVYRLDDNGNRTLLGSVTTNNDGRTDKPVIAGNDIAEAVYELVFHAGDYLKRTQSASGGVRFLDIIPIRFGVSDASQHYHVPLLLSPFGYSTYRGS